MPGSAPLRRAAKGPWLLRVTYPTSRGVEGNYFWGCLDPYIVQAVGRLPDATGTTPRADQRDLSFAFSTEGAARKGRQRVLNLHYKGVRTEVVRR